MHGQCDPVMNLHGPEPSSFVWGRFDYLGDELLKVALRFGLRRLATARPLAAILFHCIISA
jgi:hypothetical protein